MKNQKSKIKVITAAIGLLALTSFSSRADSFNATNIIDNGAVILADPTNSIGVLTGSGISVPNQDKAGFYISGYNATTTASVITVKLVRSGVYPPVFNAFTRSYESSPQFTFTATTPGAVGPYYYYTNLDTYTVGSCAAIGIASITNAGVSGASFTNADFGVVKKIIPIRYP